MPKVGRRIGSRSRPASSTFRRDKATSNICTAQVLLAIMASMYGVYHGPEGLTTIARRVHGLTQVLAAALRKRGLDVGDKPFFDTLRVRGDEGDRILAEAARQGMNLRGYEDGSLGVSLDETATLDEVKTIAKLFGAEATPDLNLSDLDLSDLDLAEPHRRTSEFMTHRVFHRYRSEHELLRYIHRLQARDLSMTTSMISLGSCTMSSTRPPR